MPAQLSWLEQLTLNQWVGGSNPSAGTKNPASALKNDGDSESQSAAGIVLQDAISQDLPVGCDFECDG